MVMVQEVLDGADKVIGLKQTLRALQQGQVEKVYYASDTEEHLIQKIAPLCRENNVPLLPLRTGKKELGKLCRIEVGAAIVAIVRN